MGVTLAVSFWLAFVPGRTDSVIPLAAVYVFGGAGLIYGMWLGEEVPRLRRHRIVILVLTVVPLCALAGSSWLRAQRSAEQLEQPVENPGSAR